MCRPVAGEEPTAVSRLVFGRPDSGTQPWKVCPGGGSACQTCLLKKGEEKVGKNFRNIISRNDVDLVRVPVNL